MDPRVWIPRRTPVHARRLHGRISWFCARSPEWHNARHCKRLHGRISWYSAASALFRRTKPNRKRTRPPHSGRQLPSGSPQKPGRALIEDLAPGTHGHVVSRLGHSRAHAAGCAGRRPVPRPRHIEDNVQLQRSHSSVEVRLHRTSANPTSCWMSLHVPAASTRALLTPRSRIANASSPSWGPQLAVQVLPGGHARR